MEEVFVKVAHVLRRDSPVHGLWFRLYRNVQRFRGGLAFKGQRLVYHSTLGWRVKKKEKQPLQRGS